MKMRRILFLLLFCAAVYPFSASYAQPAWSPEVRSQREMQWLRDSLHISRRQYSRISPLSLKYQRQMDAAAQPERLRTKGRTQEKLARQKDADMKKILDREQYQKYYRREKFIRQIAKKKYPADRQPM